MSFSYSGIVSYGKSTLPSVDSWGQNNNILRDPPKSIHTRRIDKVGQTSSLVEMVDDSGDRVAEGISLYARGVDPMVSVSFSNAGNNGGQRGSSVFGGLGGSKQVYLPHPAIKDGAFRPPVLTQYQLMPLSRQPRLNTETFTNKQLIDFSKKLQFPGGEYREVKENTLKVDVRPTKTIKMNGQLVEPFEVKYVIKNPVKFDSHAGISGKRTQDLTTQEVKDPLKEIQNPLYMKNVYSNQGSTSNIKYTDISNMNTGKYIQDTLHTDVNSSKGSNLNKKYTDISHMDTGKYIQDTLHTDVKSSKGSNLNKKYTDISHMDTGKYIQDTLHTDVKSSKGSNLNKKYTDISHMDTGKYIQDTLHTDIQSNVYNPNKYTMLEEMMDLDVDTFVKDIKHIDYTPIKTGYNKENLIHKDLELDRRVIQTEASTNKNDKNIYIRPEIDYQQEQKRNMPNYEFETKNEVLKNENIKKQTESDINSREYMLKPTINAGEFTGKGNIPLLNRIQEIVPLPINQKVLMNKKINEMRR